MLQTISSGSMQTLRVVIHLLLFRMDIFTIHNTVMPSYILRRDCTDYTDRTVGRASLSRNGCSSDAAAR